MATLPAIPGEGSRRARGVRGAPLAGARTREKESLVESIAPSAGARWALSYARRLAVTDAVIVVATVFIAQVSWLGIDSLAIGNPFIVAGGSSDTLISIAVALIWLVLLPVFGSREPQVVGVGSDEYKRVAYAALATFGAFTVLAYLLQLHVSRGYLLVAVPAGFVALLVSRGLWRIWLRRERRRGNMLSRVILLGSARGAAEVARVLGENSAVGYQIVGASLTKPSDATHLPGSDIAVVGQADHVTDAMRELQADTVLVVGSHGFESAQVRELSWRLQPNQHLIVAPNVTETVGPRVHVQPIAGLPLMHIETPRYRGANRYMKRSFDVLGAALILILISPLMAAVAIAIRVTSPGAPALFGHTRIGRDGRPFRMLKFRSMIPDAEAQLPALLAAQGTSDTPLFKVDNDPRITGIGRIIRKTSIDELPQLFNVLGGSMSLVGPRPQVAGEVALYDAMATRRLTVRPGMTGLWQVSGRSSLAWEDAIRLDLFYVENWSITQDVTILWHTARTVLMREGAV